MILQIASHSATDILIYLAMIAGGIVLLTISFRATARSKQAQNWLTTDGEILSSELDYSRSMNSRITTYNAKIEYRYKVNDKVYISKRIYFGSSIMSSSKKEKSNTLKNNYKANQNVTVYYNPDNHSMSVLETGYHSELNSGYVIGIILIIMGICFFIFGK